MQIEITILEGVEEFTARYVSAPRIWLGHMNADIVPRKGSSDDEAPRTGWVNITLISGPLDAETKEKYAEFGSRLMESVILSMSEPDALKKGVTNIGHSEGLEPESVEAFMSQFEPHGGMTAEFKMDDVVFEGRSFELMINYPLRRPAHIQVKGIPDGKLTPRQILTFLRESYHEVYRLEDKDIEVPDNRNSVLVNRAETNGMFGIWGHSLRDLALEVIEIRDAGNGHAMIAVAIGS